MSVDMHIGPVGFWMFIIAMVLVVIGVLDMLRDTNILGKIGFAPSSLPVYAIGFLVIPHFSGIGDSISKLWGDVLPMGFLVFIFSGSAITNRPRKGNFSW